MWSPTRSQLGRRKSTEAVSSQCKKQGPRQEAGSYYSLKYFSKLEKWPPFPNHSHPSPGYLRTPFHNPSSPWLDSTLGLACILGHGARFSLLMFPLILEEMTVLHISAFSLNRVLGVSGWGRSGRGSRWKEKMAAFLTAPKYGPQHQQTKQGML